MNHTPRSRTWFRLAALYFAIGVMLGVTMGASGDHSLFAVHAHINLLGWVSMALFGVIGALHPSMTEGRAAAVQFWTYNLGVPVMLGALTLRLKGFADGNGKEITKLHRCARWSARAHATHDVEHEPGEIGRRARPNLPAGPKIREGHEPY